MEYRAMMRLTKRVFALLAAALSGSVLQAVPATELKENYQSIIERNPFGLKPPPPPAADKPPEKEKPKSEIFLTGITSIGYPRFPKQAYFYTMEQGKKEPTYYALSEGEIKDGIKIMDIDPQQRKVRISMNNSDTVLSFETHGVKVAAVAAKPGMPGAANLPVPGQVNPQPGMQPLPMPTAPNSRAMYDANGQPAYNSGTAVNTGYQTAANAANPRTRQIPSRQIRGGAAPQNDIMAAPGVNGAPAVQEQQRDPAEQYLRMHLNRAAQERDQGIPMPPLPTFE
jgi:hypothetical protein